MYADQRTASLVMIGVMGALTVYVLASIVNFRLKNRDLEVPKTPTPRQHSFFLHFLFREWWYQWSKPVVGFLVRRGWHPNSLTYLSLAAAAISAVFLALRLSAYGGLAVLVSGAFDSMDGRLARETGQASKRGAFLDSTLDRFGEIMIFLGLCLFFRDGPFLYASLFGLAGSVMVSYARARGHSLGVDYDRGWMQRPERIVYIGGGAVLDPIVGWLVELSGDDYDGRFLGWVVILVAVLSIVTAVHRVVAIARKLD